MRRGTRRGARHGTRRGAAAIEFALIMPVFFAIFSIVVDLGWFFWRHSLVLDAAREGCRVGADVVHGASTTGPAEEADIESAAIAHADAVLTAHGLTCDTDCTLRATWDTEPGTGYEILTMRVEYPFEPLIGIWPGMDGPVGAEFTMFTATQR